MKGFLSQARLEYVLFHLTCHIDLSPEFAQRLRFARDASELPTCTNRVVFLLSKEDFQIEAIREVEGLPILFPVTEQKELYYIDSNNNLIFCHDILKSAFYLLSGYQEYQNKDSHDALNRFSFLDSIQYKLGFVDKPIVNYYFGIIVQAISLYGAKNNLPVSHPRIFNTFGFILSHDVDYIDLYTKNYFLYKVKEVVGIKQSKLPAWTNFKLGLIGFLKYSNIIKCDNPYWNFDFMRKVERDNNLRSVFYFLDRGILHSDSYYSFNEHRMIGLFKYLKQENCEIGLHGTVESISSREKMKSSIDKLQQASNVTIVGVRQHRLLWHHPETALIQESLGLKYDTTLGFAAHEGFRNSYCHPFRIYNFEEDRMTRLWEFPLNVMDVTLFAYQKYTIADAYDKSLHIMHEVKKFGGVFSLLWHNSFFDEDLYPGVTKFYAELLEGIALAEPENILGTELADRMDKITSTYGKK